MKKNIEDTVTLETVNNIFEKLMKDKNLEKLLEFKLEKTNIEPKDLTNITQIVLNGKTIVGENNPVYFEVIQLFPNLKKVEISNLEVSKYDMEYLKKIEDITFRNCKIEKIEKLENVKKLSIKSCEVENITKIGAFYNLTNLELINIDINNFEFLKKLKNLRLLKIINIKDISKEKLNFELPIEYLSIKGLEKLEIEFLNNYRNLKTLSIPREKEEEWYSILKQIEKQNISILIDDIYEF